MKRANAGEEQSGAIVETGFANMEIRADGIWIIDADAETAYANERMAEILGTSPSEMVGRPSFSYVFPEDVDAAQRLFEAKTRGGAKPFHFKLRRSDGAAVWVDVKGTPMHNAADVFTGIVGTFTVSTEQAIDRTRRELPLVR